MSYISAWRNRDQIYVWERVNGERILKIYQSPLYFYEEHSKGKFESIYGHKLKKRTFNSLKDFREAKNAGVRLFESDIPPEIKILSEHYYGVPAPALHVTFFDIEVNYALSSGFASVSNPYAPVNSVALYHQWKNEYVVIAVPPETYKGTKEDLYEEMEAVQPLPSDHKLKIHLVHNERALLRLFLTEIEDSDLISGWNSRHFDVPYVGKRLQRFNNDKMYFNHLSFPEGPPPEFIQERNIRFYGSNMVETLQLYGRISADYLDLFKKYEVAERPSYKLESIADEVLPDLPKLSYEGSLAELYVKNFPWFVRYNIRDTEILKGFEERLGYVALANEMCHLSTAQFDHVVGTLKLSEYAMVNYCHHVLGGLIVNDMWNKPVESHIEVSANNEDEDGEDDPSIKGAYVLDPKIGMHEWIGSIDINSLYPSSIRSINISPETLRGQFKEEIEASDAFQDQIDRQLTLMYEDGTEETKSTTEWRDYLISHKWAVSGFGTVFDQTKQGIIPRILEDWYNTRKKFQKQKAEAKTSGDKLKAAYYDRLQYVYKIKLNSFYGALTNKYFRFFDLRMGESTTGTGRKILKHQCSYVNYLLTDEYTVEGDAIIYGDTDSSYFKTYAKNKKQAIKVADAVAEKVNLSYQKFMKDVFLCSEGFDNIIKAGREIVSDRGIFVKKKRYILHLVDVEGIEVDKLKVMGLDTKKTILPKAIASKLNSFIERLLKGEHWDIIEEDIVHYKEELSNENNIMLIGLPKGVKKVEYYTGEYNKSETTRLPGHVAASIFYNIARQELGDTESPMIMSGMKIKVFYLNKKYGRFKSIALPGDLETAPPWFTERFSVDKKAHIERLVDNPLNNILKAIDKRCPSRQSLFEQELLEY